MADRAAIARNRPQRDREIAAYYLDRNTLRETATHFGVSHETVRQALRRTGTQSRAWGAPLRRIMHHPV